MGETGLSQDTRARTVLVVDDRALPRLAMRAMLADSSQFRLVGEAASGEEAVRIAKALRPDVILLDVEMPGQSGPETAQAILRIDGIRPLILAWTVSDATDDLIRMMHAGCSGYILKDVGPQELVQAVNAALRGDSPLPRRLLPELIARVPTPQAKGADGAVELTSREVDVLRAIARGMSSKEIGRDLNISRRSVETHLTNLYRKLNVTSRGQAVRSALKLGLLETGDF